MHDKLQELCMKIVRQKTPNEPEKWSRIWRDEDFHSIMSEKMAMDNVEAIKLFHLQQNQENTTLKAEAFSKMNRLRLLIIRDVNFSGSLNCLSNNLRYLEWKNYPFTYFPSSCELVKLVELFLPYNSIKQLWGGIKPLYNLKVMDLYGSKNLVKTPDLSRTPNLERLILERCTKLVDIHPSVGLLRKLVYLNLKNCTSLLSLPNSIFGVSSLEVVDLYGCSKLFHSKLLENVMHGISDNAIQCQSTSSIFKRLKLMLPFHFFNSGRHNDIGLVLPSLARFYCLRQLDLSYCALLDIPDAMASFYCLEILDLTGNNFVTLPCIIKELPRLLSLRLDHCKQLTSLPEFPLRIVLPVREELVYGMNKRAGLSIFNCPKLFEMESWSSIALSWMIQFLKVHKESSPPIAITIPGTQIPSWFNTQSANHSITIEPFPSVHDNNWIGLAFCVAFVAQCDPTSSNDAEGCLTILCAFRTGLSSYCYPVAEIIETDGVTTELVHLHLVYFTRQELMTYIRNAKRDIPRLFDGFSFHVFLQNIVYDYVSRSWADRVHKGVHLEVKHYGMRTIFKQDIEELNRDE